MSKGVHESSGCARHIPVYVYISVEGSRVCKPCNVLDVQYVLVWYETTLVIYFRCHVSKYSAATYLIRLLVL